MEFLTHATALASLAVVAVQQILKLKIVPNQFANKYPVPTLIILSVIAAIVVHLQANVVVHGWTAWLTLVASIGVVAAITYNMTLRNWSQLRSMEG